MVHPIITGIATGIGLLTDKYMLGATNFVEHYAVEFHATDAQKDFVKAAMYGGAILGMIVMGPLSDIIGRLRVDPLLHHYLAGCLAEHICLARKYVDRGPDHNGHRHGWRISLGLLTQR